MPARSAPAISAAEKRRQQTLERRRQTATEVLAAPGTTAVTRAPQSFMAETMARILPPALVRQGLITFDQQGQPRVVHYDPALLARNPQRGRVMNRGLDVLAASLDAHGQQEPIVARLITDTDRQRWPDAFSDKQILLILKGHRIYYAQPQTNLKTLRVELMLPLEEEDDLAYSRRALRRAAIKVMHSQSYDIFDKTQQYSVWCDEFALQKPKDTEVAAYFEISRSEAQRVKAVAQLDPAVAQDIINADRRPADEVIFTIANRPRNEHREAYQRFGHLTVAAVRRFEQAENAGTADGKVTGAGRPRNFVLTIRDEAFDISYIGTNFTPMEWKRRGGARAFWKAIQQLVNTKEIQERIDSELG